MNNQSIQSYPNKSILKFKQYSTTQNNLFSPISCNYTEKILILSSECDSSQLLSFFNVTGDGTSYNPYSLFGLNLDFISIIGIHSYFTIEHSFFQNVELINDSNILFDSCTFKYINHAENLINLEISNSKFFGMKSKEFYVIQTGRDLNFINNVLNSTIWFNDISSSFFINNSIRNAKFGVRFSFIDYTTIKNNTVSNSNIGFVFSIITNTQIFYNLAMNNINEGFLGYAINGSTIYDNKAINNGGNGFVFIDCDSFTLENQVNNISINNLNDRKSNPNLNSLIEFLVIFIIVPSFILYYYYQTNKYLIKQFGAPNIISTIKIKRGKFESYEEFLKAQRAQCNKIEEWNLVCSMSAPNLTTAKLAQVGGFPDYKDFLTAHKQGFGEYSSWKLKEQRKKLLIELIEKNSSLSKKEFQILMKAEQNERFLDWLITFSPSGLITFKENMIEFRKNLDKDICIIVENIFKSYNKVIF